jgi:hypothetical protein
MAANAESQGLPTHCRPSAQGNCCKWLISSIYHPAFYRWEPVNLAKTIGMGVLMEIGACVFGDGTDDFTP